jgi:SAM-dependent methyltransferase
VTTIRRRLLAVLLALVVLTAAAAGAIWAGVIGGGTPLAQRLHDAVSVRAILDDLATLQRITRDSGGVRAGGTSGELRAADFVAGELSQMGYEVEGVDISPHMLEVARKNLAVRNLAVPLHLGDVKEMQPGQSFDYVLSMGNSLPHEFGDPNLLRSLGRMYDALRPGGLSIVHIENFDRLYRDGDRFIPSGFSRTAGGTETFIFAIDYFKDLVVFNILSMIEENGVPRFNVDVVEYNPVPVAKLGALMAEAGFHDIEIYGDFQRTPIEESESYDAIFVAHK